MARILIVEDDDSVRAFAARALAGRGHLVEAAEDGDIGLDAIRTAEGAFDLVVSDIRMPAMDGIAMARAAREAFPAVRILLMTGYADQRERAAEIAGTVVGVLDKPFSLADFVARVEGALVAGSGTTDSLSPPSA